MPLHIAALCIEPIAAFTDNYFWLLSASTPPPGAADSRPAWIVDPGDAEPVLERLRLKQLHLEGVLLTHHHGDHDGGIPTLLRHFPALRVVSGKQSASPFTTEQLADKDTLSVLGHNFQLMDVPGHTLDHVAFYCPEASALFSGDTLFAGGCGRLFEGSAQQLFDSLSRLAALPANTLNFCAHEYTLGNLAFALTLDPDNTTLQKRLIDTRLLRHKNLPSIPSLLSLELATNPFLRCREPSIMTAAEERTGVSLSTALDVFTAIRAWKDHF